MADYRNGYEIRHPAPGPEAAMSPHKASGPGEGDSKMESGKGASAHRNANPTEGASGAIPGTLAPQVTKPAA